MAATLPVRLVAVLYVVALLTAGAAACRPPHTVPAPALVPPTSESAGALQVSRSLLPLVIGRPRPWAQRTVTPRPTVGPRDTLIASVIGFARVRGVDGAGTRGASCVVRSLDWSGAGTLADCLARPGRWITFAARGRLTMRGDLAVPSNTTIDARGAGVQLWGGGLIVKRSQNVIVAGLAITECDEDALQITEHAAGVYLEGLDLSRCGDGLVDVTDGATDVTLAHSTLRDHDKAMLIGASDGHTADAAIRVTLHDVIFATTYRHPMCRYAYVHMDRVTVGPWRGDAVDARYGCRVLITRSWFVPGGHGKRAAARDVSPESPGAIRIEDSDLAGAYADAGGVVPDPVYGVIR